MRFVLLLSLLSLTACSSPAPRSVAVHTHATRSGSSSDVTDYAESLLGTPYHYGGNNPDIGFDCSGFVSHVYRHTLGIELPRSSYEMSQRGRWVGRDELRPGDLLFFNTLHQKNSHVGIFLGGDSFIHSPSSGGNVRIDDLGNRYWRNNYNGARRISD